MSGTQLPEEWFQDGRTFYLDGSDTVIEAPFLVPDGDMGAAMFAREWFASTVLAAVSHQQEAVREWAWIVGQERPDRQWLLSDYDTWERNPHYQGSPQRHPEDDAEDMS